MLKPVLKRDEALHLLKQEKSMVAMWE